MKTTIYALTDSHQESRNLSRLLSGIYNYEKDNNKPFLVLDAGDLFKGIYDKELSVNAYLRLQKLLPQAQIFITLGNNDFGFNKSDFEYLKRTAELFRAAGISVICSNITDMNSNSQPDWIVEYKITQINGQKILILGFCLNNSCAKKFKCTLQPPETALKNLIEKIKEPYDKIIVLNHHWYPYSLKLKEFAKEIGVEIMLIIGGHEHSPIPPDYKNNIFYPLSFARTMYKIEFENELQSVCEISFESVEFSPIFEEPIIEYEQKTGLKRAITKRVLNLTKCYSDPCPLGTFISDNMKEIAQTDIAFHSTGFTMHPLRLQDSDIVTKYDLEQVMCPTTSTIEKIEINTEQLKRVFENALSQRGYKDRGNARFLQCSKNIEITCAHNAEKNTCKIIQLKINNEKLLDENQEPLRPQIIYTCAIDAFIGAGEQGFEILKTIPKTKVLQNNAPITLSALFYNAVQTAGKTCTNPDYPKFKIIDIEE